MDLTRIDKVGITTTVILPSKRLDKVGMMTSETLPPKRLIDLEVRKDYPVSNIKFVPTVLGKRVVIEFCNEFSVFLPAKFGNMIESDKELFRCMVESVNNRQLYMNYTGRIDNCIEFSQM